MTKCALITGGRRGIGLGIAEKLAEAGFNIAVCGLTTPRSGVGEVEELASTFGVDGFYFQCDVADATARKKMLDGVLSRFGALNVLVNNAGVAPKERVDITEMTEDSYDRVMDINLKGPFFLTQLVARHMLEQHKNNSDFTSCIINIGSISATVNSINRGEYCISKAGVSMMTSLWAVRLAEAGIPVYEIRPGIIETDMTALVKDKYDKLISDGLVPQKRWGYPEDIAKAAVMLANGDLAYSTGQVIQVDGGMTIPRL
ncbi:MAG: 3-ketoacyl-ACP reductase [Victivallaceae bacterium]